MPGFLADATLKARVTNLLKQSSGSLPTYWDAIIQRASSRAWEDIRGALILRGYTEEQILGWDRGREFQEDIGTFWALVDGGALHDYSDGFIRAIDRRAELKTVAVSIGGNHKDPNRDVSKLVDAGLLNNEDDRFTRETEW